LVGMVFIFVIYCLEWSRASVVREDLHEDGLMTF